MVNQQLFDYIRQNLDRGVSREEIKKSLFVVGWQESDIEEGFRNVSGGVQRMPSTPIVTAKVAVLPGVFRLIRSAWVIYKQRLGTFLGIMIAPILSMFMFGGLLMGLGISGGFLVFFIQGAVKGIGITIFYIILIILAFIANIIAQLWGYVALLYAIKDSDENIGIIESFRRGWHKIISYWWISVLIAFIGIGGFMLGIIPGIIFTIWFSLAIFVLVAEDIKGLNALLKSKEYIKRYWWNVVWRGLMAGVVMTALYLIMMLPSVFANRFLDAPFIEDIIDIIGNYIAYLFTAPFITIYAFLIYKNLRAIKGEFVFEPKKRGMFIAFAIWGVAALLIIPILAIIITIF